MRIPKLLLLLSAFAAAKTIPVLTEPRVLNGGGNSLSAWNDTAVCGLFHSLSYFQRKGDQIVPLYSIVSNSINSETPNVYHTGFPHDFALGWDNITQLSVTPSPGTATPVSLQLILGSNRIQGGAYSEYIPSQPTRRHLFVCGKYKFFDVAQLDSVTWSLQDSLVLPMDAAHPMICDVEDRSGQGVIMSSVGQGVYSVANGGAKNLLNRPFDTLQASNLAWVLSGHDGLWLAHDRTRGAFYRRVSNPQRFSVDSLLLPTYQNQSYYGSVGAVRGSIVAFSEDSDLVLASWTDSFKILSKVPLAHSVTGIVVADSFVWVQTTRELYSFRISWQAEFTGSVLQSGNTHGLSIHEMDNGANFSWTGKSKLHLDVLGLDGRCVGSMDLAPNQTSAWQSPRRGLFLAKTPEGIQSFVIR